MDKISSAFKNKNTNIGFILAGYPNLEHSRELLLNLDKTKIDLLEIGVPYSDPQQMINLSLKLAFYGTKRLWDQGKFRAYAKRER